MCRFVVYKGLHPILLADLLTRPTHSIIKQSFACRERMTHEFTPASMNADGFGVGWYTHSRACEPCVFTSVTPAWNNTNLHHLANIVSSDLFFAHIRAATPGLPLSETNCHPFQHSRFLFMHNGCVARFNKVCRLIKEDLKDSLYDAAKGTTDSELCFMTFLNQLDCPDDDFNRDFTPEELLRAMNKTVEKISNWCEEEGISDMSLLNFAVTDGETVVATRYVSDPHPRAASLYFTCGSHFECDEQSDYSLITTDRRARVGIIASEPLTANRIDWLAIPRNHAVLIRPDMSVLLTPVGAGVSPLSTHLPLQPVAKLFATRAEPKWTPFLDAPHQAVRCLVSTDGSAPDNLLPRGPMLTEKENIVVGVVGGKASAMDHKTRTRIQSAGAQPRIDRVHFLTSGLVLCMATFQGLLFAGSHDNSVYVWNHQTFTYTTTLTGHTGAITALCVLEDEGVMLSFSRDCSVIVWDLSTLERCRRVKLPSKPVCCARVASGELWVAFWDMRVRILRKIGCSWKGPEPLNVQTLRGSHLSFIQSIVVHGRHVITACGNGRLHVWNIDTHACELVHTLNVGGVWTLSVSDGCSCGQNCAPRLFSGGRSSRVSAVSLERIIDACVPTEKLQIDEKIKEEKLMFPWAPNVPDSETPVHDDEHADCCTSLQHDARGDAFPVHQEYQDLDSDEVIDVLCAATCGDLLFYGDSHGFVCVWNTCRNERVACIETAGSAVISMHLHGRLLFVYSQGAFALEVFDVSLAGGLRDKSSSECLLMEKESPEYPTRENVFSVLRDFVSIPTVSGDPAFNAHCLRGCRFLLNIITQLKPLVPQSDLQVVRGSSNANPAVCARLIIDPSWSSVILYGHYDVVPADREDGWLTDPFVLTPLNGYLYGRGATDNKGPVIASLVALRELLVRKALTVNILLVYEGEEENRSNGTEAVLEHLQALGWLSKCSALIVTNSYWIGTTIPCLVYGMRGVVHVRVDVHSTGKDVHAGVEGGSLQEPMVELVQALASLKSKITGRISVEGFYRDVKPMGEVERAMLHDQISCHPEEYMRMMPPDINLERASESETVDILMAAMSKRWCEPCLSIHNFDASVRGDIADTLIPRHASARFSMRLVPNQDPDKVVASLKAHLQAEILRMKSRNTFNVHVVHKADWWESDPTSVPYRSAVAAVRDVWGVEPLLGKEGGTIPIVPLLRSFAHAPVIQIPFGQGTDRAHLQNERIRLLNLLKSIDFMAAYLASSFH